MYVYMHVLMRAFMYVHVLVLETGRECGDLFSIFSFPLMHGWIFYDNKKIH